MSLRVAFFFDLGSYALLESIVPRDATVVAKLRDAGTVCIYFSVTISWWKFVVNWKHYINLDFHWQNHLLRVG